MTKSTGKGRGAPGVSRPYSVDLMTGNTFRLKHGANAPRSTGITPTYRSWITMRERVLNPRAANFRLYGGRGITICEQWDSFPIFLADVGERPLGTSLDRINNDGNYEPGNVRWATASEQARNKRPQTAETIEKRAAAHRGMTYRRRA